MIYQMSRIRSGKIIGCCCFVTSSGLSNVLGWIRADDLMQQQPLFPSFPMAWLTMTPSTIARPSVKLTKPIQPIKANKQKRGRSVKNKTSKQAKKNWPDFYIGFCQFSLKRQITRYPTRSRSLSFLYHLCGSWSSAIIFL